jgi:uncharacterized protein YhjY with autotransporter beta-barrel domain/mono/diheme cytochrome c family protein
VDLLLISFIKNNNEFENKNQISETCINFFMQIKMISRFVTALIFTFMLGLLSLSTAHAAQHAPADSPSNGATVYGGCSGCHGAGFPFTGASNNANGTGAVVGSDPAIVGLNATQYMTAYPGYTTTSNTYSADISAYAASLTIPVIVTPPSATFAAGAAYSTYQIVAPFITNDYLISTTSYSATGLPAGVTLCTTAAFATANGCTLGTIYGTVPNNETAQHVYNVSLTATNTSPVTPFPTLPSATANFTITVNPPTPVISSGATATGQNGNNTFSYAITASNSPTSYSVTQGTCPASCLPTGLSFSGSTITGTPTVAGTFTVTVNATNAGGTGSKTLTITINPPTPVISSATTATGQNGTSGFSYAITASNSPASYSVTQGTCPSSCLPTGLSFSGSTITGTPTVTGTFTVTVNATNTGGTGSQTLTITINPPTPVISSATTATGQNGTSGFSYAITASNFPASYSVTQGTCPSSCLPTGLTFSGSTISGTPTVTGTFTVTVNATNTGGTGSQTLTITINPPTPVINSATSVNAVVGTAYPDSTTSPLYQITTTLNNATSYSVVGTLPNGLFLDSTLGVIYGTPTTTAVTSTVTVRATNTGGTGTQSFTINLNPVITGFTPPTGSGGTAYSYQITSSNSPTTYALASGSSPLPTGITLSTGGLLSGTPSVNGSFSISVTATNAVGASAAQAMTIVLNATTPSITSAGTANAIVGSIFTTYNIVATNVPTSFNATGLPPGLNVNTATGAITGTPTSLANASPYTVTLSALNAAATGTKTLTITVAPEITAASANAVVGTAFNYSTTATNVPTSFTLVSGSLPPGLSLNTSSGAITGTPLSIASASPYSVVLNASNAAGTGANKSLTISVSPFINSPSAVSGSGGIALTPVSISATNSPTSYALASGSLPNGVALNTSTGIFSGTPTVNGIFPITVTATNSAGTSPLQAVTITLNATTPVVNSASVSSGSVASPFTYTITAANLPTSYAIASGGVSGVTLNTSTGVFSGTPTTAGLFNLTVTATNAAGTSVSYPVSITISQANQIINFGAAPSIAVAGTAAVIVSATSTLPVSLASSTPSICSIAGTIVSGLSAGTCTISASQSGNGNYFAATPLTQNISIGKGSQTITFGQVPINLVAGGQASLSATSDSGLAVTYSTTSATCSVNGSTVTGISLGTCAITASQAGNANYAAATPAIQNISVGRGGQTITFGNAPTLVVGGTATVSATATSGLAVTFSSLSTTICTTSGNVVTGISGGTCIIAANQAGDANYTAAFRVLQSFSVSFLPPTVSAASMTTQLNTASVPLDLISHITGAGITGISISSQPTHGTALVSGTKVTYTPKLDYFGTDTFEYVAYNPGGKSSPAAVTVTITGRPDPTKDTRVTGIVNTQTAAVKHFGTVQVLNFQQRLESRHHATYTSPAASTDSMPSAPMSSPVPAISAPGTPTITAPSTSAGEVSIPSGDTPAPTGTAPSSNGTPTPKEATPAPASTSLPGQNFSSFNSWNPNSVYSLTNNPNTLLHAVDPTNNSVQSDPITALIMNLATGLATSSTLNLGTISSAAGTVKDESFSKLDIWAAGNLRFGTSTNAGVDTKFATDGVSVGADKRFTRKLTMGLGMGYAIDNSSIGTDGTYSHATGVSLAGYGTYQWDAGTFLDTLLGYGKVNFDTNRYVPAMDDFARVARKGDQLFGSLAFGYDYRDEALMLSPYGRYDFSYNQLDRGTETGSGSYALSYDKQKVQISSLSAGLRAQSAHQTDFGLIQPHARIELQRSIESVGDTSVSYADLLGTQYGITGSTQSTNALVLGIGSDFLFGSTLKIALNYERFNSPGTQSYQAINFRLNKTLDGKNEFDALMDKSYTATITKPAGLMMSASLAYDSNVTRASDTLDIKSDTIYGVSASKALSFTVSKFTRLKLSGFIDTEQFRTYSGLGHISGGGEGEFMYRTSADFDASTFGIFARFTDDAYESTLRNGTRTSAGLTLRKPLTDRISFFAAVAGNERRANTEVFNTKDASARANFDYAISMGQTFYLTGEYRKGDIVSTGQPSLKVVDMSTVFVKDDVFTATPHYDYRMKGRTALLTLGYNYSLGSKDSMDISWRGVRSSPDFTPDYATPASYLDNQYSIAYLMVF